MLDHSVIRPYKLTLHWTKRKGHMDLFPMVELKLQYVIPFLKNKYLLWRGAAEVCCKARLSEHSGQLDHKCIVLNTSRYDILNNGNCREKYFISVKTLTMSIMLNCS